MRCNLCPFMTDQLTTTTEKVTEETSKNGVLMKIRKECTAIVKEAEHFSVSKGPEAGLSHK